MKRRCGTVMEPQRNRPPAGGRQKTGDRRKLSVCNSSVNGTVRLCQFLSAAGLFVSAGPFRDQGITVTAGASASASAVTVIGASPSLRQKIRRCP